MRATVPRRRLLALIVAAWLLPAPAARAASESYVTFSPSPGDAAYRQASGDVPYAGAIPLESWRWGVTASADGLRLVKRVDRRSPAIFRHLRERTRIASARLTVRDGGGGPSVEYCLEDVRLTGIATSYGGGDPPVEELVLTYASTRRRYVAPSADGAPSATVFTAPWDYSSDLTPTADVDCGVATATTS